MIKLIHWLIQEKLLVNLTVVLIIVVGYMTATNTNREAYPEVNFDMVSILTIYPGGSPDEIEQLISLPIEKKLREVDHLDKVRSYSIENVSVIAVYIDDDASNLDETVQEIKDAVDLVDNLPSGAEKPVIEELKFDNTPAINVAIYGSKNGVSYNEIRDAADEIEDFLYDIEGVAEVEDFGYYDREFHIEVDPKSLTKYRMGMNTVINTLRDRNIDLPGGSLKVKDKEFILRTKGQYQNIEEIKNTVIMSNDAGYITKIKDIASVMDTFEEADVLERFNGHKAIIFTVWKKRSADEIILVDRVKSELGKFKLSNAEKVKLAFFEDTSRYTRERIRSVIENGIVGFILLAAILLILLGLRVSMIVTFSIPIAFMTAFFGMKAADITLNVISLFGMIMVLGMIVDFGIVVSENSHRYMEKGINKIHAIETGVAEVFWPVTTTLLCICTAFTPLLFLSGILGKFIIGIPAVLMVCLTASWFIALFIMPTHLNVFLKGNHKNSEVDLSKEEPNYERGFFGKVQKKYKGLLNFALKHRYLTFVLLMILFIFSMFIAGRIGFIFMPPGGEEQLEVKVKFPTETNLEANLREIKKLEKIILKLPQSELDAVNCKVGEEKPFGLDPKPGEGTHKSTITINLTAEKDRERKAYEINADLRKEILLAQKNGMLAKVMNLRFEVMANGPPVGKPINVEIRGENFSVLKKIADEYIAYLKSIKGVTDITLDLEEGKKEFRYSINEVMATRSGISAFDIAVALNACYEGAEATSVRKGDEEIKLRVLFPERERERLKSLDRVMVANQEGGLIPLSMVTDVNKQPGYTQISRLNFKRLVQVQAEVDTDVTTSIEVNTMLAKKFKDIEKRYSGYLIAYGGEQEDTNESMSELGQYFQVALLIIFIVLAVFFGSLMLPLVVMIAIPFGIVGVIFALWLHGQTLSFMATLGIMSLAGVIVSNTLVLVQFINNLRDEGLPLKDALLEGGVIRLRPVLLTTGTTVLALFPTIYGFGGIDYFVAPLALSFGYGLIFATIITLILVPSFYYIAEDIKGFTAKIASRFGIKMRSEIYSSRSAKDDIPVEQQKAKNKPKKKRTVKKKSTE